MSELYVGDVGATIIIDLKTTAIPVGIDVRVFVEAPNGISTEWILEAGELNRSTGIITHKSKVNELPYDGEYRVQCREVGTSPEMDVGTTIDTFIVLKKISVGIPQTLTAIYTIEEV